MAAMQHPEICNPWSPADVRYQYSARDPIMSSMTLLVFAAASASLLLGQEAPLDSAEGRILGVIPNNKTVPELAPAFMPLAKRQKFNLALKDTVDPFTFVLAGFYSGIAQWQNDFPQFGQGSAAYGKRYGAAYADQAIGNYLTEAILPSMLHQDPRYFRKGSGGTWRRVGYAVTRSVVTRNDAGRNVFNYSEIVGNALGAGISNLYYPASKSDAGEAGEKLAVQLVSDGAFNVLLEFWPDLRHAILKR
jgi:hypothetical protein